MLRRDFLGLFGMIGLLFLGSKPKTEVPQETAFVHGGITYFAVDGKVVRVEYCYGLTEWYKDGITHREDGPAVLMPDGTKHWCRNGKFHREDGPAIECANGENRWYRDGVLSHCG